MCNPRLSQSYGWVTSSLFVCKREREKEKQGGVCVCVCVCVCGAAANSSRDLECRGREGREIKK